MVNDLHKIQRGINHILHLGIVEIRDRLLWISTTSRWSDICSISYSSRCNADPTSVQPLEVQDVRELQYEHATTSFLMGDVFSEFLK